MTAALAWYRRYPRDFRMGVEALTLEQRGAYSTVIDLLYEYGGRIADNARWLAGMCNCSVRKWGDIRATLIRLGKLQAIEGHLTNRRATVELQVTAACVEAKKHRDSPRAKAQDAMDEVKIIEPIIEPVSNVVSILAEKSAPSVHPLPEQPKNTPVQAVLDVISELSPTYPADNLSGFEQNQQLNFDRYRYRDKIEEKEERKDNPVSDRGRRTAHAADKSSAPRNDRGSRLPEGWTPDEADVAFATGRNLNVKVTLATFRDYWRSKPGAAGRKVDWSATWRNWCRKAVEYRPSGYRSPVITTVGGFTPMIGGL